MFTLTYRSFTLENGEDVPNGERLGYAVSTVAEALDVPIEEVERLLVARAADPSDEPNLRLACKEISEQLQGLPGVRNVSAPRYGRWPLSVFFRRYALARSVPLPKLASPSERWLEILRQLRRLEILDEWALSLAAAFHRLKFESGEVVDPLEPDERYETLAALSGSTPWEVASRLEFPGNFGRHEDFQRLLAEAARALSALPGVVAVDEVPPRQRKFPAAQYEGPPLLPPWTVFSDPPSSMRWRMGGGEDVMNDWWWYWEGLTPDQRRTYFDEHPVPDEWKDWAARALTAR